MIFDKITVFFRSWSNIRSIPSNHGKNANVTTLGGIFLLHADLPGTKQPSNNKMPFHSGCKNSHTELI